jgi:ABC-2 type transport system ATP-binding protein
MEEAEALSDKIAIMANGKLKAIGTAAALMADTNTNTLEDAFIKMATKEEVGQ